MIKENFTIHTVVTGSDDGACTYEISRSWDPAKKPALLIALYPTIDIHHANSLDMSTMFMLNHATQMNLGSIRIINLYSKVQIGKPSVSYLKEDLENLAYISDIFDEADINNYHIIIAWGSSLAKHKLTINSKLQILQMIKDKGLIDNVMQLTTDELEETDSFCVHPLYLGLHHNRSNWKLCSFPFEPAFKELSSQLSPTTESKPTTKKGRKKKCTTE